MLAFFHVLSGNIGVYLDKLGKGSYRWHISFSSHFNVISWTSILQGVLCLFDLHFEIKKKRKIQKNSKLWCF